MRFATSQFVDEVKQQDEVCCHTYFLPTLWFTLLS